MAWPLPRRKLRFGFVQPSTHDFASLAHPSDRVVIVGERIPPSWFSHVGVDARLRQRTGLLLDDIFDRHIWIAAMLIEEIDAFRVETLQRGLGQPSLCLRVTGL
jgi:hypothetical protein